MRRCTLSYLLALLVCAPSMARAENPANEPRHGLERLIRQAIQNHPDIAAAQAERRATEFEVGAARNQFYPTPALQLRNDKDGMATVASLTQPLWTGGRLTAGLDAAQTRAASAELATSEVRYNLALRVVNDWAALAQAQGRESAQVEGVALLQLYAASVYRRIQGGASAEVDNELVAARLAQAQSELAAARAAHRIAKAQLAQLVGLPPESKDLGEKNPEPAYTPIRAATNDLAPLDELIKQATDYSPTLRRIDTEIESARFEVDKKRADLWPVVNLRAEHQRRDANAINTSANDSRIMLTLDYTPDAGLAAGANINAAQSRIVTQQEKREAARRDLTEAVRGDYEEHLASVERTRSIKRALAANTAVLESYDRLLVAGKRSWLDVLNIARELTLSNVAQADIDALMVATRYRLRLHVGELDFGELPALSSYKSP